MRPDDDDDLGDDLDHDMGTVLDLTIEPDALCAVRLDDEVQLWLNENESMTFSVEAARALRDALSVMVDRETL